MSFSYPTTSPTHLVPHSSPTRRSSDLVRAWPQMPIFGDAGPALTALRERGWRLAFLTNCDEDLFATTRDRLPDIDRKSTRLNSSHPSISYAVFCLKKKNKVWCEEVQVS